MPKTNVEIGNRYGYLQVLEELPKKGKRRFFKCKCDCGNEAIVRYDSLTRGVTSTCGCKMKMRVDRGWYNGMHGMNSLIRIYKDRAKEKKQDFTLTRLEFQLLTSADCYYCGAKPVQKRVYNHFGEYTYNGIDRINNDIGYILENCVTCCRTCNYAKHDSSFEEFLNYLHRIGEIYGASPSIKHLPQV